MPNIQYGTKEVPCLHKTNDVDRNLRFLFKMMEFENDTFTAQKIAESQ